MYEHIPTTGFKKKQNSFRAKSGNNVNITKKTNPKDKQHWKSYNNSKKILIQLDSFGATFKKGLKCKTPDYNCLHENWPKKFTSLHKRLPFEMSRCLEKNRRRPLNKFTDIFYNIYLTPPLGQDMTRGQFFKKSLTGFNSEFSFS